MTILAYLGPETMLPMTSVIAGIVGFVMMFGRKAWQLARGLLRPKTAVVAPETRARGRRPTVIRRVARTRGERSADMTDASHPIED